MNIPVVHGLAQYVDKLFPIVKALSLRGGTAYLVGGCVRDLVLHMQTDHEHMQLKDLDIEVHGIDLETLHAVLSTFGHVEQIGKKFGVLLLLGLAIDWSLPRTDSSGRKPQVILQPHLSIEQALQRRDLTMNAMAINVTHLVERSLTTITLKDIIDPFGGLEDIFAKKMCAVDDNFFVQDPLRLLRVMQFVGRFGMTPTPQLDQLCASMPLYDVYDDTPLARERIQAEVVKLLLQSPKPSIGFAWLLKIGRAKELFPFLCDEIDFEVFDQLASCIRNYSHDEQLILLLALLWYQRYLICDNGKNCAFDQAVFNNCTQSQVILKAVAVIVLILPRLKDLQDDSTGIIACKKIAAQLTHVNISFALLAYVTWCLFEQHVDQVILTRIYQLAQKAGVLHEAQQPLVQGRDLLKSVNPGPQLGKLVARAYQLQLEQNIQNKQELINHVLAEGKII